MAKRTSKRGSGSDDTTRATEADAAETVSDAAAPGAEDEPGTPETTADAADAARDPNAEAIEDAEIVPEEASDGQETDTKDGPDVARPPEADETADPAGADVTEAGPSERPDPDSATDPEPPEPVPAAPPPTVVEQRGPGVVPLLIGGVLAVGLGYGATVLGLLPGAGSDDAQLGQIETTLVQQSEALAALQEQLAAIGSAELPEFDLSPVTAQIEAVGARLEETAGTIATLTDRVEVLEERPVFTGEIAADAAEAAEAVAAMEAQMRARQEEAERAEAEAEEARRAAEAAIAEAEATAAEAAAAAEAEAARAAAEAEAEAAINALRLAVTAGTAFEEALADAAHLAEDVPEVLTANAATGVQSLDSLQDAFPAAARAALPVALREAAGDGAVDRFGAFLRGQIGGRAVEPREGDDPDAVLSRAQAAVTAGDLAAALAEIETLPEAAQAEMSGWIAAARARVDVTSAVDSVADAVENAN